MRQVLLVGLLVLGPVFSSASVEAQQVGQTLRQALEELRGQGLRIVYSTALVGPELVVSRVPEASTAKERLAMVLAEHHLELREVGPLLVVGRRRPGGATEEDAPRPEDLPRTVERIQVVGTAGLRVGAQDGRVATGVGLGGARQVVDPYVGASSAMGASTEPSFAKAGVRGGRADEVGVLLDGVEIFAPFHLEDFGGVFSVLPGLLVEDARLDRQGSSAELGSRMSGFVDFALRTSGDRSFGGAIELSPYFLGAAATLKRPRATLFASARSGQLERVARALDLEERPAYEDALVRLQWDLPPRHSVRVGVLPSVDELRFASGADDRPNEAATHYRNTHGWIGLQSVLGRSFLVDTNAYFADLDSERSGSKARRLESWSIDDRQRHDIGGLSQSWSRLAGTQEWAFGAEYRVLKSDYRHFSRWSLESPTAVLRHSGERGTLEQDPKLDGWQFASFIQTKMQVASRLQVDLGLRYESDGLSGRSKLSPRLGVAATLGRTSQVRLAAGRYTQAQRPYEVDVADGMRARRSLESALDLSVSGEHVLGSAAIRWEGYRRRIEDPRPRFLNVLDPFALLPEMEADRVRIAADRSTIEGLRVDASWSPSGAMRLEGSVATQRARDRISGRFQRRETDRPIDLRLKTTRRFSSSWEGVLVLRQRSGRPVPSPGAIADTIAPQSPMLDRRLESSRQIDLRLAWFNDRPRWSIRVDVSLENVLGERPERGLAVRREDGQLVAERLEWFGRLPGVRVALRF